MMKGSKLNFIDIFFIVFIVVIILGIVILFISKNDKSAENIQLEIDDTTRNIVEILQTDEQTTEKIVGWDISLSPMENVRSIMENGIEGKDYITKKQNKHPSIYGNAEENNAIMHSRLYSPDNRLTFSIPTDKKGVMLVKLKYSLNKDRDMFLALNGSTMGILHKDKALGSSANREYIFNVSKMYVANRPTINLYNYMTNNNIQIGVFVAQQENYVESLSMIFY